MSKSWIRRTLKRTVSISQFFIKLKARKNWEEGKRQVKCHYTENFCCWNLQWPPYWGQASVPVRGPCRPAQGKTCPCRGTICLMLYVWSFQMKGKPSLKREAGGLGQFRIQHKDKTNNLLFSGVHSTLFNAIGSLTESGGWVTWNGPEDTWQSWNILSPAEYRTSNLTTKILTGANEMILGYNAHFFQLSTVAGEGTVDPLHLGATSPAARRHVLSPRLEN